MLTSTSKNELAIGKDYAKKLISRIDSATSNILVLMYDWRWYTNDPYSDVSLINHAFIRASRRGLEIRVLTNYANVVAELSSVGIKGKLWPSSKLMHSKCIIIDNKLVVMGSHNFTMNAMRNNIETSMFFDDSATAEQMTDYFNKLWQS